MSASMASPPAGHLGGHSEACFGFTKEQCAGIVQLQQRYQNAGDHQSAAYVAQYAAAGIDLSSHLEAAAEHFQASNTHDPSRRFSGTVRSWNPDGGFGFIVCAESRAIYNKDIFLHKSEIGHEPDLYKLRRRLEFKDGEPVSFQVEYDDKLKPRAKHVELLSDSHQPKEPEPPKEEEAPPLPKKRRRRGEVSQDKSRLLESSTHAGIFIQTCT